MEVGSKHKQEEDTIMMNNAFDENIFGSLDSDMKKSDLEYVVT